jgi:hypothetical protein
MATRSRATFAKRQREIQRMERARDKAARRVDRKESRVKIDRGGNDDPDIEGIVPGPQALPYETLEGDISGDELVKAATGKDDEDEEEEAS